MFGAVGHDNLTGAINAPKAAGNPAGWFSTHDGFHHVVYRSADGHLHELWWQGQGGVGHGDLTAQAQAVPAAGDPWPYYDPVRATNIVVFRGTDGHIRSLYWGPNGAVGQDDLSGFAGTPTAGGDPFAWFTPADDTHRIVYRAGNGHLYELAWPNVAPVSGRDLTALSGTPSAAGNVSGGYNPGDNTQHVIYRSADGRLHELWHFLGEAAVHHTDLTAAYGAPSAADRPVYYATGRAPNQHVAYRGTNGHIYRVALVTANPRELRGWPRVLPATTYWWVTTRSSQAREAPKIAGPARLAGLECTTVRTWVRLRLQSTRDGRP